MDLLLWQGAITKWLRRSSVVLEAELLREWSQSRVVRIKILDAGVKRFIFAKQAHVGLDTEVTIYGLANRVKAFPAPAALCVSIDGEEWLLLEEAKGTRLANSTASNYRQAANSLAVFHERAALRGWPDKVGLNNNLPDRISMLLEQAIDRIRQAVHAEQFTEVDLDLVVSVQSMVNRHGPQLIRRLTLYPTTLVHGDCHSGNIFLSETGIQMVDWGSASVAPGLLDMVGLIDVAERMSEPVGHIPEVISAYWSHLSADTRDGYSDFAQAWRTLRVVRALLELQWFLETDDDYGRRANRELKIIYENLLCV